MMEKPDICVTEENRLANGILTKARKHERLSNYHRKKSRDLMTRLEQFKACCAELGIAVNSQTGEEVRIALNAFRL
jgi:hypothetical protein